MLAVGLLGVSAVTLLLAAYQFGKTGLEDSDGETPPAPETDTSTITAGEGFTFVHTIEGREVFHIQAERNLRDREETTYLETVTLDIFREDGETYRVTSNNARVNETTWQARLEGDVVVSGFGDLELEARAFDLQQGGQLLVSSGAVEFRYPPNLEGRATALRIDRLTDTIVLSGGVHIRSSAGAETPMRLDCERLVYRRGESVIRARDDVYIRFGNQQLSTRSLTINLLEDQRSLRSLRARFDVAGTAINPTDFGGEMRIDFLGESLELEPDAADPTLKSIRLAGSERTAAVLKLVDADGLGRAMRARYLESQTANDQPVYIRGAGEPMVIDEFLDMPRPYPLRQVCASTVSALFLADGSLDQIYLENQVELWNRDVYLSGGSKAQLGIASGQIKIEGPEVELFSERGDLAAPRITYTRESGLIRAEAGVRASLEPGTATALEQSPFGQGRGPIRVESKEAFYTSEPAAFTFVGGVRAWRDENLLLAEQLRADQSKQEMAASGGVRTLWFTSPKTNGTPGASQPIEVTSSLLSYQRNDNVVIYSGDVQVEQAKRTLTCGELSVELEANGQDAKEMTCRRDVEMIDPAADRRITGDIAVYTVPEERVEVFGDQVLLLDSQSNRLEGKYLLYNLGPGTVQIRSRVPELAQP
ncbi:MAG: LPS export ABC transporter periplasmic protein LptC [Acidobacteriota bacterium]